MNRPSPRLLLPLLLLPVVLSGGCPSGLSGLADLFGVNVITLELINDTDYDVDPWIVFDDDSGWLAGWFPAEELATGLLAPGEVLTYTFDCNELGLIRSDEPEQFVGFFTYTAAATDILERGDQFDCGDLIQFQFVGNADAFGVVVAVNGFIVD